MFQFKQSDYTVNFCTEIVEWAKEFYGLKDGEKLANKGKLSKEVMAFAQIDDKEIWIFVPRYFSLTELKETIAHEIGHIIEFKFKENPEQNDENDELHEQKADFFMDYFMLVDKITQRLVKMLSTSHYIKP